MYDDELMIMMFTMIGLAIIVLRQFFTTRRLKKRVSALELRTVQPAAHPVDLIDSSPPNARDSEVDVLRKRVQVLERIATDGNPVLEREIEALRRAG